MSATTPAQRYDIAVSGLLMRPCLSLESFTLAKGREWDC